MSEEKITLDVIQLSNYVRPEVKEVSNKNYVMNGTKNEFYTYIIERYNGSPTNRAIIDSYAKFIYGKGLTSKQQTNRAVQFAQVLTILDKKNLRNICQDYAMFSEDALEIIYKGGKLQKIKHVPKNQVLPSKMDENGDINSYWFSLDFNNERKYKPIEIPKWESGKTKNGSYIYIINSYQVGRTYFTDPDYMAGLPYAELEEEIANYCINHIKNGLSVGHAVNMNSGEPSSEEVRNRVKQAFQKGATGSSNAGNVLINWNDGKETEITISAIEISNAHEQYEFLSKEATQKLLISHKVTSPILFGVKDNTGLGNNANEMEVAFNELMINVIQPKKEVLLDAFMEIFSDAGISIDLDFIPLREVQKIQPTQLSTHEHEQDPIIADALIELGENISLDEWDLIDEIEQKEAPILTESTLRLTLASVPSSFPNVSSEQDTSLFKIRYVYSGSQTPEREFCAKMMKANKVYRKEDIELAETKVVNAGLGKGGADTYSIWLYKGGVNCKHFWQRQIYLKKNNGRISVNDARKIILDLDPKDRPLAKWQENDPLVAQPAQPSNNNFKA